MDVPFTIGVSFAAFAVATLVLMSGFGLSTTLTPVLAIAYPVRIAVMLVAIMHFSNNALRLALFWKHVDWGVVVRFGVLSIAGALVGAFAQEWIGNEVLKIILGAVLIVLGLVELVPRLSGLRIPRDFAPAGGIASGFLGGLTGNQGAIRSAYLINYGLSRETFVGTATMLATFIDLTRIPIYIAREGKALVDTWPSLLVIVGKRLLKHISLERFRQIVGAAVVVVGVLLPARVI